VLDCWFDFLLKFRFDWLVEENLTEWCLNFKGKIGKYCGLSINLIFLPLFRLESQRTKLN
jgi:hypothetical protein